MRRRYLRAGEIATPFHGSNFSNVATQWLGDRLINLPEVLIETRGRLIRDNPGAFVKDGLIDITTSVESLSPDCTFLRELQAKPMASWVKHHNIMGNVNDVNVINRIATATDGIVGEASSRATDADSEVIVSGDHISVHRKASAILEVRRILLEHLAELRSSLAVPFAGNGPTP